jgi:hypothetical protein
MSAKMPIAASAAKFEPVRIKLAWTALVREPSAGPKGADIHWAWLPTGSFHDV